MKTTLVLILVGLMVIVAGIIAMCTIGLDDDILYERLKKDIHTYNYVSEYRCKNPGAWDPECDYRDVLYGDGPLIYDNYIGYYIDGVGTVQRWSKSHKLIRDQFALYHQKKKDEAKAYAEKKEK
jgi:hypothetical protein